MRIIDKKETITWLSGKKLLDSNDRVIFAEYQDSLKLMIPVDSGKKTVLSKTIASLFADDDEAMLWVDEFGIWPSSEDRNLFDGFRRSLGENSRLFEKPGHIFSKQDLDSLGSLVAMILYFCWGAVLVSTAKNLIIRISHDEIIYLYTKDKKYLSDIQGKLRNILKT